MPHRPSLLLLTLLLSASAHAQLYKSVGADGKVTYSDVPPSKAAKVETRSIQSSASATPFPYELAEAVRKAPVTLYTSQDCSPCDSARKALKARGIPFSEKTVQTSADIASLKQAGGTQELPFVLIGSRKETGFEQEAWNKALTAAGYPANSQLPRTYRHPDAQSAAPASLPPNRPAISDKSEKTDEPVADEKVENRPKPGRSSTENAPPGFRF